MDKIIPLLEQMRSQFSEQKVIIALIDDVVRHNNLDDEVTIRSLNYLSYWLYITGNEENALCIAQMVNQITNLENVVIKGCKHNCLVLCSYIHAKRENENQSNDFWNKLIDIHFGDNVKEERKRINRKKWNRNITTGDNFESFELQRQNAENNNHIRGVVYYAFRSLEPLFWMSRMGGSEKYPLEKINQLIGERMFILKENIDNADVKDFVGD